MTTTDITTTTTTNPTVPPSRKFMKPESQFCGAARSPSISTRTTPGLPSSSLLQQESPPTCSGWLRGCSNGTPFLHPSCPLIR
ncbi:hypothetical protein VYU27_001566 [Nannochloropsis oceanica]